MKTFSAKNTDVEKKWYLIDAENAVPGRLAALVATRLRGKHKPYFTPHTDCGDNIIIVNAAKVKFTGNKYDGKIYYWHTGYPGGIKNRKAAQILEGQFPQRIIQQAVKRMMPSGPLARKQLGNLYVYKKAEHPHQAQKAQILDIKKINDKNTVRN